MNVSHDKPPQYLLKRCENAFDLKNTKPIFTYGTTIYNPFYGELDEYLIAHENVHAIQQGDHPKEWWDDYLADPNFRYQQELEAYRVQFRVMKEMIKDKNKLARGLFALSRDLSSPMYGNLCTQSEAFKAIKKGI